MSILPPLSYLQHVKSQGHSCHSRLALEVLHDVQEPIIYVWLLRELDFDLVQVAESILFETGISTGVPRKHLLPTSVCIFGTAVVSHIEYGLLSLVHVARNGSQRMTRRHAGTEGHVLRGTPTAFRLEGRPEHGRCTPGRPVGRHGSVGCRGEHLMLRRGSAILDTVRKLPTARVTVDSSWRPSWPRRRAKWHACWVGTVVGQQATRAVYCAGKSVRDRLVDWDGAGVAVVRRAGWVWFSICAVAFAFPLLSFSFTFPLSLTDPLVLLEERVTVPLLVHTVGQVPAEAFRGEWTRGHSSRSIPQSDCRMSELENLKARYTGKKRRERGTKCIELCARVTKPEPTVSRGRACLSWSSSRERGSDRKRLFTYCHS